MDATRQQDQRRGDGGGDRYGVLLYYKYAEVPDAAALAAFYEAHCRSLALVGRVRVGPDGVNATLGGRMMALEKHIAEMSSNTLFEGTDFKLASCEDPVDERVARECGFTSLSVRVVKELVTLCSNPMSAPPEISSAGRHLSAAEFHSVLQNVAGTTLDAVASAEKNEVVVVDARNVYETRIGKFNVPNVETLDPEIRQYSDLPSWVDEHTEKLRGKSILMYCTGGIRCEMASAYIRSKGEGFENVFQLYGGIQRYLEQFPDGGYFEGKNFVFDHSHCRMLVLVCPTCQVKCCTDSEQLKKLRILCLHGFRQNASNFKGRTSALAKKLKHIAVLIFVDAPHELSFVYQPIQSHCSDKPSPPSATPKRKFAWLIAPNSRCNTEQDWKAADAPFDPLQYQQQTEGFEESYAYLENAISEMGSFDRILGFSQGAAMAASFCRQQQRTCGAPKFRFGMFCSGYPAPVGNFNGEPIKLPSLHCFGNGEGHDRQIANRASAELAGLFQQDFCSLVEHDMGHIIPTRSPYIDQIKDFLSSFL
ncbi:rhodanese-like domain-containing protein 6 [Panicum miliaceum]|uniref:Rhodanese-like domain-containing protein 6 n=1 Tax=Panicum miliaceum TaxID=4540 RepID=A0A3L6T3U4_PANMI|nr:rhodanese-like domain-containing protein 6 [Panicum miliaceum]